jgi:SpoIID/LytB domain protein
MRRVLIVVVVFLLAALAGPIARAQGGHEDFTFFGSGFGHGLGMSQWGAYGLSNQGWGPTRILRHYYSGTRIGTEGTHPGRFRVGLVQSRDSVRLEAQMGDVEIRLGDPANGDVVATVPAGQTWRVHVAGARYRILDQSGDTVDRVGGPSAPIYAVFQPQGSRVRVPEASHTYNRGWIEFGLYDCASSCAMRLVLVITPEEYLYGLGEVPSSWPMTALKAQAIAARTYAFTKAASSQHRPGCDCALYASSFDQVYAGWDKEGALDGDRWVQAVDETDDRVVVDAGDTIQAFYMSSSGGFTEDNENVWGGTPIEYLRGVCDPGDYTTANPSATWEVTYTAGRVTKSLSLGIGTITGFANPDRGVSGRIISVTVQGQNGSKPVTGAARPRVDQRRPEHHGRDPGEVRRLELLTGPAEVPAGAGSRRPPAEVRGRHDLLQGRSGCSRAARARPGRLPGRGRAEREPAVPDDGRPASFERQPARGVRGWRHHVQRHVLPRRLRPTPLAVRARCSCPGRLR